MSWQGCKDEYVMNIADIFIRCPIMSLLENQLSTIAGVDSMTSTNGIGTTRITLQFTLDRDIDAAAQDVQAAISLAIRSLPKDMPTPPSFRKVNPAEQPDYADSGLPVINSMHVREGEVVLADMAYLEAQT